MIIVEDLKDYCSTFSDLTQKKEIKSHLETLKQDFTEIYILRSGSLFRWIILSDVPLTDVRTADGKKIYISRLKLLPVKPFVILDFPLYKVQEVSFKALA